ncbi:hypothetical protein Q4519_19785 [Motilimonas sp. 1_MG-2023]|uniref:hypothetical protein n=1 Tax=Motilimonas sp. 1_MG-2023 TaxID=3062672 RepID=UPI0026E32313|nr:hypothetical protein [Motilimonas sp. 1_MG-2023]MDO6527922.1 hypothetical protein [Motilimonas sp. 1_MG-2023]
MLQVLKRLIMSPHQKAVSLRNEIVRQYAQEVWFTGYFHLDNGLYEPQPKNPYDIEISMIGAGVRTALIKHYLVSNDYYSKLLKQRKKLVYVDSYGDEIKDKWVKEVANFATKRNEVILSFLREHTPKVLLEELKNTNNIDDYFFQGEFVNEQLNEVIFDLMLFDDLMMNFEFSTSDSIDDYITTIALTFRQCGWKAAILHDNQHKADIHVERNGVDFIVLCKYLDEPVSEKTVQESIAMKNMSDVFGVIIVTNIGYTDSAIELSEMALNFDTPVDVFTLQDELLNEWILTMNETLDGVG